MIDDLAVVLELNGVEIRPGVTASATELAAERPDVVVFATGSTWDRTGFSAGRPDRATMPGADQDHVMDVATAAWAALGDPAVLGARVLILDDTGTYLPLGLAELLGEGGVEVEVLSRLPVIGDQIAGTQDLPWLLPRLGALNVRLSPNHFIEAIHGSDVDVYETLTRRARQVEAVDTVVLSMLRSPDDVLFRALRDDGTIPHPLHRRRRRPPLGRRGHLRRRETRPRTLTPPDGVSISGSSYACPGDTVLLPHRRALCGAVRRCAGGALACGRGGVLWVCGAVVVVRWRWWCRAQLLGLSTSYLMI